MEDRLGLACQKFTAPCSLAIIHGWSAVGCSCKRTPAVTFLWQPVFIAATTVPSVSTRECCTITVVPALLKFYRRYHRYHQFNNFSLCFHESAAKIPSAQLQAQREMGCGIFVCRDVWGPARTTARQHSLLSSTVNAQNHARSKRCIFVESWGATLQTMNGVAGRSGRSSKYFVRAIRI